MSESFFRYQERRLNVLWAWGVLSALVGLPGLILRNPLLRHVAIQTSSWGAIDAVLAWFGRRSARKNDDKLSTGALSSNDEVQQARRFRIILLINAVLDVGYIIAGVVLARQTRPDRRGMGLGIIPQGLFLLIFDGFTAWEIGQRDRQRPGRILE